MTNIQSNEHNPWNPFEPTTRDIERTEILAKKSKLAVFLLGFLISPLISAIYLNRGINLLKIFGYTIALSMVISVASSNEEEAFAKGLAVGYVGSIVIMTEQLMTIGKARKREPVEKQDIIL